MSKQTYNWKRFWCPPSGRINLADSGFLVDPDDPYGAALNPDVVPWDSISPGPCLILLGEPGIGKSSALDSEKQRTKEALAETGDHLLWVDLRRYQSDQRLHEHVFESKTLEEWRKGTSRLHLFVDSMDECLMRIENIGPILIGELSDLPVERLSLRIACRTAEWPRGLENQFRSLWGDENVSIYELAPLRRADVLEAARASRIEPADAYVEEVIRSAVVPLAIKPVTLQLLLNAYRRSGSLPSDQTQLYTDGCRLLCEESRDGLRPAPTNSDLTAEQKLTVAKRVAAVTIFCGRDAVWTDVDRGDVPDADIRIPEIAGEAAAHPPSGAGGGEQAIRQALNTGLFSSRGLPRVGWAHQTYAEFLAARFLIEKDLSPERMMSLLIHPDGKIVPQLHETAAWLASMVPVVFRRIVSADPEMLLWTDVMTARTQDRMALVENLLRLFDQGHLMDLDWDLRRRYRKLGHPQLAEQLRPYIRDKQKGIVVRRVAIGIAESCEVKSLEDDLVAVSLDQTDDHEVRVGAAFAVSQWGSSESKKALRPLALGAAGDDPDDDLRGCGLICVWPDSISAIDLFGTLTPPKRTQRFGMYESFLRRRLVEDLAVADLPAAVAWTEAQLGRDSLSPLARLADEIRAWALDYLDRAEVAEGLASATWKWVQTIGLHDSHERAFRQKLVSDVDRRRALVLKVIPLAMQAENWPFYLFHAQMLFGNDFSWLLEQMNAAATDAIRQAVMVLVKRTFNRADAGHADALRAAAEDNAALASEFTWFLNPESPEAEAVRQQIAEWEASISKPQERALVDPPPDQRVATLLAKFESGDLDAFWRLNAELTLEPDSTHYGNGIEPSIKVLPGWKSASDETRRRIAAAASRYLTDYAPPRAEDWLKTDSTPWASLAGYRALLLLLTEEPGFFTALSADAWSQWAPMTLAYPYADDSELKDLRHDLLKRAYRSVPETVLATLNSIIDKENEQHGTLFVLSQIDQIWDARMAARLAAKAADKSLKPAAFGGVLDILLKHGTPEAREVAKAAIDALPTESEVERERAVVAAQCLARNADDAGWDIVWPAVTGNDEFGMRVLAGVSSIFEPQASATFTRLGDDELADLYIWLATKIPYRNSGETEGFGFVSPSRSLEMWRDRLIEHLKLRGTPDSAAGMRRIVQTFPQYPWLTWHLMEADRLARFNSWSPLRPVQLFALLADAERRLVQTGEQLLGILDASLKRLQQEMQGETPAAFVLWNELPSGAFRPKIEVRISDHVKLHFVRDIRERGIVVNREVEIRKGTGTKPGEETDIHVDAVVQLPNGTLDEISAIIEVKGCWNDELMTAMDTQLVERYLKDNACPFGLYLIGWFMCDQWDSQDYRRARTPKMTVEEARDHFDEQAANLSNSSRKIRAFVLNAAL
jgi:predicted NACHT family NTPase